MLPLEFRSVFFSALFAAVCLTLFVCAAASLFRWRISRRTAWVAIIAAFVLLALWAIQHFAPVEAGRIPIPL
jgi:hypothetical protein